MVLSNYSDEDIIRICKNGNRDAFEEIVLRHEHKVFNMALGMLRDYDEAAEAAQEAFISAFRGIEGFRGDSRFSTWLYRIVVNTTRNRLKRRRHVSIDDPDVPDMSANDPSALDSLEENELRKHLRKCVAALEPDFREVVTLRDMQGLSYAEIAEVTGVPDGTLKSRLNRARQAVRDCLKKVFGEIR